MIEHTWNIGGWKKLREVSNFYFREDICSVCGLSRQYLKGQISMIKLLGYTKDNKKIDKFNLPPCLDLNQPQNITETKRKNG